MQTVAVRGALRATPRTYRVDVAQRDTEAFGAHDGAWIAIAALVHSAAARPATRGARAIVTKARTLAKAVASRGTPPAAPADDNLFGEPEDAIRRLAGDLEDAGALNLAASLLDDYLVAAPPKTALELGRITAHRARVTWKLGDVDAAADRYRTVQAIARRDSTGELVCRALTGFSIVARLRGNYPQMKVFALRTLRRATKARLAIHVNHARHMVMLACATMRDFECALIQAWHLYSLSSGSADAKRDGLVNVGQFLLDLGHPREARAALAAAIVSQLPARQALPALGGYALAASHLGDSSAVQWAASQIRTAARSANLPYYSAHASLEAAEALSRVGRGKPARAMQSAALAVARRHGYHELEIRAEDALARGGTTLEPTALTGAAASAAREVIKMDPGDVRHGAVVVGTGPTSRDWS